MRSGMLRKWRWWLTRTCFLHYCSREDLAAVLTGALACPPSDSLAFTVRR